MWSPHYHNCSVSLAGAQAGEQVAKAVLPSASWLSTGSPVSSNSPQQLLGNQMPGPPTPLSPPQVLSLSHTRYPIPPLGS